MVPETPKQTIHCYISGRVQGVCFRVATADQAGLMGVRGWVRNLADGRVEVMATADKDTLKRFRDWLDKGPAMAKVSHVESCVVDHEDFADFTVHR